MTKEEEKAFLERLMERMPDEDYRILLELPNLFRQFGDTHKKGSAARYFVELEKRVRALELKVKHNDENYE